MIFDLDGLMINSEELSLQAWRAVLATSGRWLDDKDYHALIGSDSQATANQVIRLTGVPLAWDVLARLHWQRLLELIDDQLEPRPGLLALVSTLIARGYPLAIASNSPTDYVERALRAVRLREAFRFVIGRDQVTNGKPAPDVYLAAAAGLSVAPECCLALEDSPTGMQAALAAGMRCVVVPNEHLVGAGFLGAYRQYDSLGALHAALDTLLPFAPRTS